MTRPKIKDFDDDAALHEALRFAMLYVGIREANLPSELERKVMINYIRRNYGNHSPEEIKLAFEMAVSGALDLPHDKVMSYENFSIEYFSRIMNSYRRWAAQAVRQNEHLIYPKPPELPRPGPEAMLQLNLEYAFAIASIEWLKPYDLNFFTNKTSRHGTTQDQDTGGSTGLEENGDTR